MINHEEYLGVYTALLQERSRRKIDLPSDLGLLLEDMVGNNVWEEYVDSIIAFPHKREYPHEVHELLKASGITYGKYPVLLTNTDFIMEEGIVFTDGSIREIKFDLPKNGYTTEFDLSTGLPKRTIPKRTLGWYFKCKDRNRIQVGSLLGQEVFNWAGVFSFVNPYEGDLRISFRGIIPRDSTGGTSYIELPDSVIKYPLNYRQQQPKNNISADN